MKAIFDTVFAYGTAFGAVAAFLAFFSAVGADRYEAEFCSWLMVAGLALATISGLLFAIVRGRMKAILIVGFVIVAVYLLYCWMRIRALEPFDIDLKDSE